MSDIASIRTSFESCKDLQDCSFARDSRGAYVSARTRGAWAAWQACTASTALQAPVREVPGWQPIETAPKDGTRIMIFMGAPWARIVTVRWFDLWENWQEGDFPEDKEEYCGIGSLVPTHWMPLPAAPVQEPKP